MNIEPSTGQMAPGQGAGSQAALIAISSEPVAATAATRHLKSMGR